MHVFTSALQLWQRLRIFIRFNSSAIGIGVGSSYTACKLNSHIYIYNNCTGGFNYWRLMTDNFTKFIVLNKAGD